ncbi:hypothetical protein COJ00_14510 [Priestia megaterium]|uniref:hypothetical protein n=1 Tax=Priestia megaterium TaxID=1404 RepID=UPI000BED1FAE|nr:hypothetical protein [Priestia megaterium]PEE45841.1 hypothetical protein COM71_18865 [Priestia megaterium]PFJ45435.1 hypothetical protein COJ00_14510 [Priestia megaterium]PGZ75392.1 hypothetical protein COE55_20135 [Priestia megaterium]
MSGEEKLKQALSDKIKAMEELEAEIVSIGKELGLGQYFSKEMDEYVKLYEIENRLLQRVNKSITKEGTFYQENDSQAPIFNKERISDTDLRSELYEVEVENGSGEYLPVKYEWIGSPYRRCRNQNGFFVPTGKELNARLRAKKK